MADDFLCMGRFLGLTGLAAGGFLGLTGPLAPRVVVSPYRAMSFIMPPAAVTSTSSIIIRITTVHPFATSWPSSPKGDARTLRDWLSVSYVTQYPVPPIFSFPLEGKSREARKGVRGRVPIGCSIAVLTANRRPVSFGLLTLRHACGMRVQKVQKVQKVQRVQRVQRVVVAPCGRRF